MQKDNSTYLSDANESKKSGYRPPSIFALPPSVYSEEMERERDKDLYLKIQKLQKNSQELREELLKLAMRKEEMLQSTQSLISESRAVKSNFEHRKIVLQEVIRVTKMITRM